MRAHPVVDELLVRHRFLLAQDAEAHPGDRRAEHERDEAAGGHLLALDVRTGIVGWDATVANPKGATELERIADVASGESVGGQPRPDNYFVASDPAAMTSVPSPPPMKSRSPVALQ